MAAPLHSASVLLPDEDCKREKQYQYQVFQSKTTPEISARLPRSAWKVCFLHYSRRA
jgi:hypothetical protein